MAMNKLLTIGLIMVGVTAVASADVLIKKVFAPRSEFLIDAKNPLMLLVLLLYLVQVFVFSFVFDKKADLAIVGIVQTALYAIIVIGSGLLFFNEKLTFVQGVGIGLALAGVTLMNI
jgi:multidrug transporter EmrE-like cation transporter